METITKNSEFVEFYNSYPMSFVLMNDDSTARCAIQKRPTATDFIAALKDAIESEIDTHNVELELSNVSHKYYTANVKATYTDHEGEEMEENFTLESLGIY